MTVARDNPGRAPRLIRFGLSLALFLIVLGANWATFERYGSDIPDMDQWDAEGVNLIAPWFQHDHFFTHLLHPQNEHRVLLTKLQNLATVLASGQWDSRVECMFNTVLHAFIAVGLWCLARRWLSARLLVPVYVGLAALYALPLSWQNLLGGFHSQQYWLIGLSFAAIVILPWARPWRGAWWLGLAAAVLAMGSMGSGFFAAAVVFGIIVARVLARETSLRAMWSTLALMAALIWVGVATRVYVDYHEGLKARTAHDFIFYCARSLEWPLYQQDWAGPIVWAPWLLITGFAARELWRRREAGGRAVTWPSTRAQLTWVALGGWVWLQLLATAYARGAGADYPASRYMDTLIFGVAVNAIGCAWLLSAWTTPTTTATPPHPRLRLAWAAAAMLWLIAVTVGVYGLTARNLRNELPSTRSYYVDCEAHLAAYLATGDAAELTDPVPYLDAPQLIQRLSPASIRAVMPTSVRPPLAVASAPGSTGAFVVNHATQRDLDRAARAGLSPQTPALASRPTWGSCSTDGLRTTGEWRSAPLVAPLHGWLRFETSGDVGRPGISLELHDANSDRTLADVRPTKLPGNTWRSAYVRAPKDSFVIVARDNSADGWLGFSAPVEMSSLSYWSWQLTKNGLLISEIGATAAGVLGLAALGVSRPRASPASTRVPPDPLHVAR